MTIRSDDAVQPCQGCSRHDKSLWADLQGGDANRLAESLRRRWLKAGETLFRQGDPSDGVHCLGSGLLAIRMGHANGANATIGLAYPGDVLGLPAFALEEPHQVSAVALRSVSVCTIPKDVVEKLARHDPRLSKRLLRSGLKEVESFRRALLAAAALSNRERLCALLYQLIAIHGHVGDGGLKATLPVSRVDLAGMLGIRPETLSRLFSRLRRERLLHFSGREVFAPNPERLAEIGGLSSLADQPEKPVSTASFGRGI